MNDIIFSKNKGEWSEFYTFIKLLADKRLDAANEDLEKISEVFFPILKIIREEPSGLTEYEFDNDKVKIIRTGEEIILVDGSDAKLKAVKILKMIKDSDTRVLMTPEVAELMTRFHVTRLSAGNGKKEDITLKIHDISTGSEPTIGFSIKSMLGAASTLLNASSATNFIYKVDGLTKDDVFKINAIDSKSKIRDRFFAIFATGGTISFEGVESEIFKRNLRRIDTVLPEVVSQLLLAYFQGKGKTLVNLVNNVGDKETDILSFDLTRSDYEFKMKNFLYDVALGMIPGRPWDGNIKAHGGYIIVREDGEVVCYHVYNADEFRKYLFKNTRMETASTSRHRFGSLYQRDGSTYIKLNLQIRFIK
jgi:type II restriction enzyme